MSKLKTVSFTDLITLSNKSGSKKSEFINQIINRPIYDPKHDYYKGVRDKIPILLKNFDFNSWKSEVSNFIENVNPKKKMHYECILNGFHKFLNQNKNSGLKFNSKPEVRYWNYENIKFKVNPEIEIVVNGVTYRVKLYFKKEKLSQAAADISLCLMDLANNNSDSVGAILDLRRSKLYLNRNYNFEETKIVLECEAYSFFRLMSYHQSLAA